MKRHLRHKLFWLILLTMGFFGAVVLPARSASAVGGITVTPAKLEFSLSKDAAAQTVPVSITNGYDSAVQLHAEFKGFDENAGLLVPTGDLDANFAPALHLSSNNLILEPGQTQMLRVTVTNPDSLTPGGHYATLLLTQQSSSNGRLNLQAAASLAVFAVKQAGAHAGLQLRGLHTNGWLLRMPTAVTLDFGNTGNVLVIPRGAVSVLHAGSIDPLAKGVANSDSLPMLPGKDLSVVSRLQQLRGVFWPSRLQLVVAYRYDGAAQPVLVTERFWYEPVFWPLLLLAAVGTAVWVLRRRRSRAPEAVKPLSAAKTGSKRIITVSQSDTQQAVDVSRKPKFVAGDLGTLQAPKPRKKQTNAEAKTTKPKSAGKSGRSSGTKNRRKSPRE